MNVVRVPLVARIRTISEFPAIGRSLVQTNPPKTETFFYERRKIGRAD
jgi:hypothetical protein